MQGKMQKHLSENGAAVSEEINNPFLPRFLLAALRSSIDSALPSNSVFFIVPTQLPLFLAFPNVMETRKKKDMDHSDSNLNPTEPPHSTVACWCTSLSPERRVYSRPPLCSGI